jgi:uncharacterized protein
VKLEHNWLTPKAEARPTQNKGWGSYATSIISQGETVACFGGSVITKNNLKNFTAERISRSIQIDDELYLISGEKPEPGDQINHSCEPNCGLLGATIVVAIREINIGEEISYDYAMSDSDDYDEFTCHCKSINCRKIITGKDWMREDLQQKYQGFFSPYLERKYLELTKAKKS